MSKTHGFTPRLLVVGMALWLQVSAQADWNADLAAIDAQIRAVAGPTYQQGNAVGVLAGVTATALERKRLILVDAGFTWFAPANAAAGYNYGNFYSFTGTAGQTDTQLRIVETTGATLLYRRGYPNEPSQRLGAWWAGTYLSPDSTRDELAVLAAWGNPLTGIYVASVPAGTRMIAGLTSPMQAGTEFRAGGSAQYWLNSRDNDWLVYALYAPDYLGSYVAAVAGAQKLNRDAADGLTAQLRDFATREDRAETGSGDKTECWFRTTAGDADYEPFPGGPFSARGESCLLGYGMTVWGTSSTARLHAGVVIGRAVLRQSAAGSGIHGHIASNLGGLYAIYRRPSAERFPWYMSAAVIHGRLWFDNTVPGYLGHGLEQSYRGSMTSASLEAGVPLKLGHGWTVTPQAQFAANRVAHGDFLDGLGAAVSLDIGHELRTRLGAQLDKTLFRRDRHQLSLWASGGAVREFSGCNRIAVAGETAMGRRFDWAYQVDTGLRFDWSERLSLRASGGRIWGDERGYRGSTAISVAW